MEYEASPSYFFMIPCLFRLAWRYRLAGFSYVFPSYFFMRFFRVETGDTGLLLLFFVFFFIYPSLSFVSESGIPCPTFVRYGGEQASPSYFFMSFFFYFFVLLFCGFLHENCRTVAQKSADRHSRAKGFCGTKKILIKECCVYV